MVGVVTFYDEVGKSATITIDDPAIDSIAKVIQLADVFRPYSAAGQQMVSLIESSEFDPTRAPTSGEAYNTCEQKAVLVMRNMEASSPRKARIVIKMPGPSEAMLEQAPDRGYRVTTLAGTAIAVALGGVLSKDVMWKRGWLLSRASKKRV